MLNAFAEQKGGVLRAVKRPSLVQAFGAISGGNGQGLFAWVTSAGVADLFAITGDGVTTYSSMTTSATRLIFTTEPVNWKINTAFSPSIVVKARDYFGNVVTSFTGDVTLSFEDNPNGGTLSGTLTVAAVSGVATFSNVKIDKVGGGYSLRADSGTIFGAGRYCISSTFKITSSIAFSGQPTSTAPNDPIVAQVTVVDSSNNAITGYTGNITLSLSYNITGGTLSGTLTKACVNGVADFNDLSIDIAGTYIIQAEASAGNLVGVNSNSFVIAANLLTAINLFSSQIFGYSDSLSLIDGTGGAPVALSTTGGLIIPATFGGETIGALAYNSNTGLTSLVINNYVSQNFFTTLTINGTPLLSASALYDQQSVKTAWGWFSALIPSAGNYTVTIT